MGKVIVTVDKFKYTAEPLYQWDLNQVLEIRGLSLPSIPEIHFHNAAMGRAIVRQASMDAAGVVTVDIPNSLLQKPYPIAVYVCRYVGGTFFSEYKVELEVKQRAQPADYTLTDDPEVYSFNALENQVVNALQKLSTDYAEAIGMAEDAKKAFDEAKATVDTAVNEAAKDAADQVLESIKTDILDDETKELYGLGEGADIDDFAGKVLDMFSDQDYKVGDMLETYRTDLGECWALCNGDTFDPEKYPELAAVTPPAESFVPGRGAEITLGGACAGFAEGGGYQVVLYPTAAPGASSGYSCLNVAYSADGFKTWECKQISTNQHYLTGRKARIFHVNGYWVVFAGKRSTLGDLDDGYDTYVCEGAPDGEWTEGVVGQTVGVGEIWYDMWYQDGGYYLATVTTASSVSTNACFAIYKAPYPSMYNATEHVVYDTGHSYTAKYWVGFTRSEEYHAAVYRYSDGSNTLIYAPANDPLNYTTKTFAVSGQAAFNSLQDISSGMRTNDLFYVNGRYGILAYTSQTSSSTTTYHSVVVYTDELLSDEWTGVLTPVSTIKAATPCAGPAYSNGRYFLFGTNTYNANGQYGLWVVEDIFDPASNWLMLADVFSANATPLQQAHAVVHDGTLYMCATTSKLLIVPVCMLPLSGDGFWYKYIKVKEE